MLKKRHVQEAGISSPVACAGWRGPGSAGAECTFGSSVAAGTASIRGTVPSGLQHERVTAGTDHDAGHAR